MGMTDREFRVRAWVALGLWLAAFWALVALWVSAVLGPDADAPRHIGGALLLLTIGLVARLAALWTEYASGARDARH